jgi:hypothetical protein
LLLSKKAQPFNHKPKTVRMIFLSNSDHGGKIAEDLVEILKKAFWVNKLLQTMDPSAVNMLKLRHYILYHSHVHHLHFPFPVALVLAIFTLYLFYLLVGYLTMTSLTRLHRITLPYG